MDMLADFDAIRGGATDRLRKVNLFQTARFFLDVYVLAPGQSQTPHVHDGSDKVYAVLSGTGVVEVAGVPHEVRAGHAVHCPAGASHGVANPGPDDLRLLVYMAPHPRPSA